MSPIRIGIIGCGGMGKYHANNLKELSDVEIVYAADMNEDILEDFRSRYNVERVSKDYKEMLSKEFLDAVIICLPTFLHYDVVMRSAEAGLHIFCEKPISRKISEAEDMIKICRENEVIFMIGFVRRFDNYWGKAKEIVDSKVLGEPVVWRDIRASSGPKNQWYFDRDKGGGPILDGMIHNFDFANFMFGDPVKVSSGIVRFKEFTAIDTGSVWVEYKSGNCMANIWSWGLSEGTAGISGMDIIGPKGVLLFPGSFPQEEIRDKYDHQSQGAFLLVKEGGYKEVIVYNKNDMFLEEMKHFVDCIKHNKKPCVTGEDGLSALRVALTALGEEELQ